jgi:hypothetical protein
MMVVDDDRLIVRNEEVVCEAVSGWMKDGAEGTQGCGVVGTLRFPLMSEEYLRNRVADTVREEDKACVKRIRSG